MSLLSDLHAAAPVDVDEPPWNLFRRTLPLLVPDLVVDKVEVTNTGRVGARGKAPWKGAGRYYWVMILDGIGSGLDDGRREVRMALDRYRDEADARVYDSPFKSYVDPQPGAVAAWMVGVLKIESPY